MMRRIVGAFFFLIATLICADAGFILASNQTFQIGQALTFDTPAGGAQITGTNVSIAGTAGGNWATVGIYLTSTNAPISVGIVPVGGGGPTANWSGSFDSTAFPDGVTSFYVQGVNGTGGLSPKIFKSVTINNSATLGFAVSNPTANQSVSGCATVAGTVGSNWVNTRVYQAGTATPLTPNMAPSAGAFGTAVSGQCIDTTLLPNGLQSIFVQAFDSMSAGSNQITIMVNVTNSSNVAPAVTTQPTAQSVTVGATATFTAAFSGSPAPTCQWFKNSVLISGATSCTSYTTPATALSDNGAIFFVAATNVVSTTNSQSVALSVIASSTTVFTDTLTGSNGNWALAGQRTVMQSAALTAASAPSYVVVHLLFQTGSVGSIAQAFVGESGASNNWNFDGNQVPLTFNGASSVTITPGTPIVSDPVLLSNYVNTHNLVASFDFSGAGPINGATQYNAAVSHGYYVYPTGTGGCTANVTTCASIGDNGTTQGNPFITEVDILPLSGAPVFTTQPSNMSVASGATATFNYAVVGTPTPTCQVQLNTGSGFANISGATSCTTYTTPATTSAYNGYQYQVLASNSAGNGTSRVASLSVSTGGGVFQCQGQSGYGTGTCGNGTLADTGVQQAATANKFLNSIGLNPNEIPFGVDNVAPAVLSAYQYLGIRSIRYPFFTGAQTIANDTASAKTVAATLKPLGIKMTMFIASGFGSPGSGDCDPTSTQTPSCNLQSFLTMGDAVETATPNEIWAIEGPNEPAGWPITFNGVRGGGSPSGPTSYGAVTKLQAALYAAVKADTLLNKYPVITQSSTGNQFDNAGLQYAGEAVPSSYAGGLIPVGTLQADFANDHNYTQPSGCGNLLANQAWNNAGPIYNPAGITCASPTPFYTDYVKTWAHGYLGYTTAQAPYGPRTSTETGWWVAGSSTEPIGARAVLNTLLSQFKRGVFHTDIFSFTDNSQSFGVYYKGSNTAPGGAKMGATWMHNLTTIVADTTDFSPGTLPYTLSSQPATVHDMLLQKSSGVFELVLWDEKATGDTSTDSITVSLGGTHSNVKLYDISVGTSPVSTPGTVSSVTVSLTDHPMILEVP